MTQRDPNRNRSPFALWTSIAKGFLFDVNQRRKAMFGIVLAAVLMLFVGSTLLAGWLRANPVIFILYWLGVAWLTLTSVLLALYDMLIMRQATRRRIRELRREILGDIDPPKKDQKDER